MKALPRCGFTLAALLVAFSLAVVASHAAACTPEAVQAVAGETQVTLSWTHPEPAPYKVLRSEHQTYGFSTVGTTEAMSFVDRGLPGRTFYYIIVAVEGVPAIEYRSATVSASPTDNPPPAPDPVSLRFSTNLWSLEWDMPSVPPDLAGFHAYQRRTPNESWMRLDPQLLPVGTRRFIGDKPQNRIYVRLGSVDRAGHESFSIEKTITPGDFHKKHPNDKDPIPTGLTATGGETIVDLAWDPLPGAFRVYRSTTSGAGWVLIDTAYANSYRDKSVPAGAYYYVVTSVDGDPPIESPYSTEASAVVTDNPPPAPVSLGVGTWTDTYSLTWSYPFIPPDLAGVRIWKSWTPGGPYVPATTGLVSASPPFSGNRPRGPMYLRLSSVDAAGHESMSAQEVVVEGVNLVRPEPKLNATRLGAAGSVTSTGGELVWDEETLTIRVEVGFGFDFHRVYRSDSTHDTVLGYGYSHTYEQSLTPAGADFDRYDGARGRTDRYTWNAATQSFTSPAGFYDKLEANPDGTYKLTDRYGLVSTFTSIAGAYRLTEERDRNGNTLGIAYDGSRVSAVTDSAGRTVNFVYGADGRLSSLVDFYDPAQPRSVTFGYSAEGDLAQVTDLRGFPRNYTYSKDQSQPWQNHNLLTCKDGKGQTYLAVTYDADTDRVVSQQYGAANQVYQFTYTPTFGDYYSVQMTDRRGEGVWTVEVYAPTLMVYRRTLSAPGIASGWTYSHNANGERTLVVKPAGDAETWTYDSQNADPLKRGNLLQHRWIGVGMPTDGIESRTYVAGSPWSLVKTHTDHDGVTLTYFYDFEEAGAGDLNGDGLTSQSAGNVVKIVHPTVTLGQPSPQAIEEKFWYDGTGRRTRAVNPNGKATVFEYVAAGPSAGYLERVTEDFGGLNLSTAWTLDAVGNVTSVTSPRENTLSFEVNRANQVTQVDGPLGYQVRLTHDENGRLLEQRVKNLDGDGLLNPTLPWVVTTRTYTILGDVASETRTVWAGENATSSFAYDAEQNLLGITYPSGRHDAFVSEGRGLVTRATFGDGSAHPVVREFTYNAWGSADSISTAAGTAWMTYDGFGRKKMTVYPTSTAVVYSYDADCHGGEHGHGGDQGPGSDAPSGSQTGAFSSCAAGFGAATSESTNKDENHRPYKTSKAHKNSQQQPIAGGTSVQSANLDPNSNVTGITTASGGTLTITRDGADRATAVFRPASSQGGGGGAPGGGGGDGGGGCVGLGGDGVSAVLDADGNPTLITWTTENTATGQLETRCQERQYDPYGRVSAIIDDPGLGGANLTTHLKHDSLGNVVEVEDPKGNRIKRTHDGVGNVRTHVYEPVGGSPITLAFGYDADGNLTTLTDGLGHTTTYTRDILGRATQVLYPNQTTETHEYDGNGWPIRSTDANGTVVEPAYNWFGMPFQRGMTLAPGVEGATSESVTYDGILRPVTITGESGSTSLEYTSLNRIEKVHRNIYDSPGVADTSFEFNSAGERTRMTYPNGRVLDFTRDDRDRLRQVMEGTTTLAAYDYAGQVMSRRTYFNGLTLEISRDALFRVTTWQHVQGTGTIRVGFGHVYDELGQKKYEHRLHDGLADVYRYDGLGQLTGLKSGVPEADLAPTKDYADYATFTSQRQFEFDFGGNRKTVDTDGVVSYYNHVNGLYVPDIANRLRSIDDTTRTHDANGNVTDDGRNTYTYNWRNQIVRVHRKSDGKLIAHYLYDAFGRRERKYTIDVEGAEAGWVDFLLDGYRIIGERDQSGAYLATYVNGNGIDEVLSMDRGGQRYLFHEDSLGSERLITNAVGQNVEKYEYTEYGLPTVYTWDPQANGGYGGWGAGVLGGTSAIGNTRMFTGREWDAEIGLYYYRSRHFDPRSGRFVSPDLVGYSGDGLTNWYRYAINAPMNRRDPFGLDAWGWVAGFGNGLSQGASNVWDAAANGQIATAIGAWTSDPRGTLVEGLTGVSEIVSDSASGWRDHSFEQTVEDGLAQAGTLAMEGGGAFAEDVLSDDADRASKALAKVGVAASEAVIIAKGVSALGGIAGGSGAAEAGAVEGEGSGAGGICKPSGGKIYRGVPKGTPRGALAEKGIVRPRGTSSDYLGHVLGEDVATDVTSWSRDINQAKRFGDILLEIEESTVTNRIVPHPAPWLHPEEQEVLIRGPLTGVPRVR